MRVSGRSQQMGRRGLTAPAARWLVDGSVPARSERRVAAVFLVAFAALLALALPAQGQTGACSRTPEVRDAILAETGAAACSSVTSTQLASITYLEIEDYSSANIVPADFAGLTTLDVLAISRSPALTTVPANAFSEVTSLTALSLEENSISSVHADAFNGLSAWKDSSSSTTTSRSLRTASLQAWTPYTKFLCNTTSSRYQTRTPSLAPPTCQSSARPSTESHRSTRTPSPAAPTL